MKWLYSISFTLLICGVLSAGTIAVINTADAGPGSLRDAIYLANANPGQDNIVFFIPGVGPHEIILQSALPAVADQTSIYGDTQPGTIQASASSPAVLKIAINGAAVGAGASGLSLNNNCVVRGIAIYGFDPEINIAGNDCLVWGCHIGLDITGTVPIGNAFDRIIVTGNNNTIGGFTPRLRNVIAGSNNGITVFPNASENYILGNYIGTDASGNNTISSNGFDGISISSNANYIIDNVVVGYGSNNILISQWSEGFPVPSGNFILDNRIGHHADGSFSSFTNNCQGISINNAMNTGIYDNTIYGNGCHGVLIDGNFATGNLISNNSIYGNNGIAINLGLDWVTANDPGDGDIGPNLLLNYPVLVKAKTTASKTKVKGAIDTPNPNTVRLEFYANPAPHATGYGDGQTLIGFAIPDSDGKIKADLDPVAPGTYISAIAIDSENNTSEFSKSIEAISADGGSGNNVVAIVPNAVILDEEPVVQVSAFPNPCLNETTIAYQLPTSQQVKLSVFDATGHLIQVLNDDSQEAGTYQIRFDATNLPAGVYVYQLITDGAIRTGKIISQ